MRYQIRKGQQRLPLGGHHYNAHGIKFTGENHIEVYEKIIDYRLNNMIPVGDPEQEVLAYYYDNFPWMVDPDPDAVAKRKSEHYLNWRSWVHRMWKNPLNRAVTNKEASIRWDVCKSCPHNLKLSVDNSPEGSETLRRAFLLRRGQAVPSHIGFCSLHSMDISVASFLEAPAAVSGKMKDAANHPGCWVA